MNSYLNFTKMHGLGNDFMVIETITAPCDVSTLPIQQFACRHTGVGFDQLIVLSAPGAPEHDFSVRFFNADGGEAELCLNGLRAAAVFVARQNLHWENRLTFGTASGAWVTEKLRSDLVSVTGAAPTLPMTEIFFNPTPPMSLGSMHYDLVIDETPYTIYPVSVGNPHAVVFVDCVNSVDVKTLGQAICEHPFFPAQTNVEFVETIDDKTIKVRIYERGAAETRACGSGATAAAYVAWQTKQLNQPIRVKMHDGDAIISVNQQDDSETITIEGSAKLVFEGQLEYVAEVEKRKEQSHG